MSTILILAGVAICGLILALVSLRSRRRRPDSMGVMNDQWLAEQRLAHGPDPNR